MIFRDGDNLCSKQRSNKVAVKLRMFSIVMFMISLLYRVTQEHAIYAWKGHCPPFNAFHELELSICAVTVNV